MQSHADQCIFSYLSGAIQAFRGQIVVSAIHIQDVRRGTALGLLSASATQNGVVCSVRMHTPPHTHPPTHTYTKTKL